ncbi:MAG: hypothetical protein AAF125_16435, partial [Chloroflexota bacterium]
LPFIPTEVGRNATIAYDEFIPVAASLNTLKTDDDTLFVLPALDGNPQLHIMTDLPPPSSWTTTHDCMLCAPGLPERLLTEWADTPPTLIVYFPELVSPRQKIEPLLAFLEANYVRIEETAFVPFNGPSYIYRHNEAFSR